MAFVGLERIQGCMKPTSETFVAPLAFPILNVFADTTFSIANERVNAMIGDAEIFTIGIGTGVTLGGDVFLAATSAFSMGVGDDT